MENRQLLKRMIDDDRPEAFQLRHFLPRRQHGEAGILHSKELDQLGKAPILEAPLVDAGRVLQRLQPVEQEQHALLPDQRRQRPRPLDRIARQFALKAEITEPRK
jgi:hypothetical protein